MKPWLFVGAKVTPNGFEPNPDLPWNREADIPQMGAVYTVRRVGLSAVPGGSGLCVWLVEIKNVCTVSWPWRRDVYRDCGYSASRFRPVSTIDTTHQVEALKKLARDATQTAKTPLHLATYRLLGW